MLVNRGNIFVEWKSTITFTKVEGHKYRLMKSYRGVTLNLDDQKKGRIEATESVSGVILIDIIPSDAKYKGVGQKSTPIEFTAKQVTSRNELVQEIKKAIRERGVTANLNYIDTSLITDMSQLFKDDTTFNGDISKWDVSQVTTMRQMFSGDYLIEMYQI